jgi:hypothetical protein
MGEAVSLTDKASASIVDTINTVSSQNMNKTATFAQDDDKKGTNQGGTGSTAAGGTDSTNKGGTETGAKDESGGEEEGGASVVHPPQQIYLLMAI